MFAVSVSFLSFRGSRGSLGSLGSRGSGISFILFQSAQLFGLLRVDHEADEKGIDAIEHAQTLGPLSPLGHGLTLFHHIVSYCLTRDLE